MLSASRNVPRIPKRCLRLQSEYKFMVDPKSKQRIQEMRGTKRQYSGMAEDIKQNLARMNANKRLRMSESGRSAAMSVSEGSAPESNMEAAKYPIEGKFKSEKDRQEIMALPEIRRETILAERADEIAKEEQNRSLRALLRSYKEGDKQKRKAGETDIRESGKSSQKSAKDKSLDELKRKREERGAQRASQASRVRRADTADIDAQGESEAEYEERFREKTPEERPVVLRDFEIIKVGRENFAKVCFYPGFEDTMVGCYVRLLVGPNPRTRENEYRMARIDSIVERRPYAMESASGNGKKFITTQHVSLSIGKTKREAPFLFCSQGRFSQQEVDFYMDELRKANMTVPRQNQLLKKNSDINSLLRHNFTDKELGEKVNRSSVLQSRYREHKRDGLAKEKEQAEEAGNTTAVARLEQQLKTVMTEPLKLRYDTFMPKPSAAQASPAKGGEMNQQQRLAQLNRERAKADQQRIRNALLEEKRVADKRRKALERGEPDPSPMARSTTIPKTLYDSSSIAKIDRTSTPANGDKTGSTAADGIDADGKKQVKMVNGKPMHNLSGSSEDLELPHPEWCFNYVEYSNKYLGSRSLHHLTYDDKGRAVTELPREMCDDEIIARMDFPMPLVPEY